MFLQVTDGRVKLAAHKMNVELDLENEDLINRLSPYQKEDFGLVAYSTEEKDAILGVLSSFELSSTVEALSYSSDVMSKAQSNTYSSRTEALGDLDGTELRVTLESRITATEDAILALMSGGMPIV